MPSAYTPAQISHYLTHIPLPPHFHPSLPLTPHFHPSPSPSSPPLHHPLRNPLPARLTQPQSPPGTAAPVSETGNGRPRPGPGWVLYGECCILQRCFAGVGVRGVYSGGEGEGEGKGGGGVFGIGCGFYFYLSICLFVYSFIDASFIHLCYHDDPILNPLNICFLACSLSLSLSYITSKHHHS